MFGGASALSNQGRIGPKTGVHSFQCVLLEVSADIAMLCGGTARLKRTARAIARRIEDKMVTMHHLLASEHMTRRRPGYSPSDWSARRPVIHAAAASSARLSGCTLRTPQQA